MSIMDMPPPPYLPRIPRLDVASLEHCYTDPGVWRSFGKELMTLCSADAARFAPEGEPAAGQAANHFRTAPFENDSHTAVP
jgi:hypothetical protein